MVEIRRQRFVSSFCRKSSQFCHISNNIAWFFYFLISIFLFIAEFGIFKYKIWTRKLILILSKINFIVTLWSGVVFTVLSGYRFSKCISSPLTFFVVFVYPFVIFTLLLQVIIAFGSVWLLNQKSVKELFVK